MIKFLHASKNSTLYSKFEMLNTGSDEISELKSGFTHEGGHDVSRILIEFDSADLNSYDRETTSFF